MCINTQLITVSNREEGFKTSQQACLLTKQLWKLHQKLYFYREQKQIYLQGLNERPPVVRSWDVTAFHKFKTKNRLNGSFYPQVEPIRHSVIASWSKQVKKTSTDDYHDCDRSCISLSCGTRFVYFNGCAEWLFQLISKQTHFDSRNMTWTIRKRTG